MTALLRDTFKAALVAPAIALLAACSQQTTEEPAAVDEPLPDIEAEDIVRIASYDFDAARGRALFVSRGCVICHSVNGVGGRAAYPLDKETFLSEIDAVNFSARMWRGAPEMIKLQQMELGYQINLSAQDIADLAAFAGNPEEQSKLTLDQVPEDLQSTFLNEFMWIEEEFPTEQN